MLKQRNINNIIHNTNYFCCSVLYVKLLFNSIDHFGYGNDDDYMILFGK